MKKLEQYLVIFTLIGSLFGCKSDDAMIINEIAGDWEIKQVSYRDGQSGSIADSVINYSTARIHFDNCNGGCNGWYSFDNKERIPFFYYARNSENNLMINVGSKAGPGIDPSVSLNGEAIFLERAKNRLILDFDARLKNNQGLTVPNLYKARAILER